MPSTVTLLAAAAVILAAKIGDHRRRERWERTPDLRIASSVAVAEAARRGEANVSFDYLVLAATLDAEGKRALLAAGIDPRELRRDVESRLVRPLVDYRNALVTPPDARAIEKLLKRADKRGRSTFAGLLRQLLFEESTASLLQRHGGALVSFPDAQSSVSVAPAVELARDVATPFSFLTTALGELTTLDESEAGAFAYAIHFRGRARLRVATLDEAARVADAFEERAREAGVPLRVVVISN